MDRRIKCINCNIQLIKLRRFVVMELDTRAISIISDWITPVLITENDYICEACRNNAMHMVNVALSIDNSGKQQVAGYSHLGHKHVCVLCGLSILRRRSDLILKENGSDLDRNITDVIGSRIAPCQITSNDRVCHSCWVKCKRAAHKTQQIEETHSQDVQVQDAPDQDIPDQDVPDQDIPAQDIKESVKAEEEQGEILNTHQQAGIVLPNYRRAANTASHCLFIGCTNEVLHRISESLRATVLSNYNYYIPPLARVCTDHLYSNNWDILYNSRNSLCTFTVQQIEHVFSFVNTTQSYLDFSSMETVRNTDENVFSYWTGKSKEEFTTLLNGIPRILESHRGILGLGALMMKLRTGDSNDRISKLLGVPRRTLERLMHSVQELLMQDVVPNTLRIELKGEFTTP